MKRLLLNTEIQNFINQNLESDISKLILKGAPFPKVDIKSIVEQIEAKKRCRSKLPTWFTTKNIFYPNRLNIEQTSSEISANYKAKLINGHSIIDITGGFGVDCFYFSKYFKTVKHCEINPSLSDIVTHNFTQLGVKNIETICSNGLEYLEQSNKEFDWIYIDPSRRHDTKGKVFFLKDCLPNVPKHLRFLFSKTKNIAIKTSPLLDLSVGIEELNFVKTIHIIAIKNEVKELLWILEKDYVGPIGIETANIKNDSTEHFSTLFKKKPFFPLDYELPKSFLYEPNAAIMKAGAFDVIPEQLQVNKLHKHTHLYSSDTLMAFPGRRFKIENVIPYHKKNMKHLNINKANITTRNFPESVQVIRKKFKIKDGGSTYLFFCTNMNDEKIVLITTTL
ncbi:THUMP-like domain-containing protein [Cognatitamlana onchidii]|uniref:THUMP-like domain-containing protein n=1 Tax=Cognatitamlana onchidii TaxID=2562860 RepID=UPI0010A6AB8F|nr:class I SAM-dependent methyltransferase [Algibacter onchidii]